MARWRGFDHWRFSAADDETINRLREGGAGWEDVARAIGRPISHAHSIRRHAIVLCMPCMERMGPVRTARELAGPDPLPAMHPIAWRVLCEAPRLGEAF